MWPWPAAESSAFLLLLAWMHDPQTQNSLLVVVSSVEWWNSWLRFQTSQPTLHMAKNTNIGQTYFLKFHIYLHINSDLGTQFWEKPVTRKWDFFSFFLHFQQTFTKFNPQHDIKLIITGKNPLHFAVIICPNFLHSSMATADNKHTLFWFISYLETPECTISNLCITK